MKKIILFIFCILLLSSCTWESSKNKYIDLRLKENPTIEEKRFMLEWEIANLNNNASSDNSFGCYLATNAIRSSKHKHCCNHRGQSSLLF